MGSGYCTINVSVTDCVELPEVAVTNTWDVPAGVPVGPVDGGPKGTVFPVLPENGLILSPVCLESGMTSRGWVIIPRSASE
jgi:hypothetical protein